MTLPRQVLPGSTVLVTRRCIGRMFLLRPSSAVNQVVGYLLAVAAERSGVQLHAYCVLSNHFHCVLTDPDANLPRFEQLFDGLVARSLNAMHGRWESFWAPGSYSAVRLLTTDAIMDKIAYVLQNPTAAGLVRRGAEWPGLWSSPRSIGGNPVTIERPTGFFRANGPLPATATLRLVPPPGFPSLEAFQSELQRTLTRLEDRAARELGRKGRGFLGRHRVLAQKTTARPASLEPRGALKPLVAARDRWKRLEALERVRGFMSAHRRAWERFARGERDTVFPEGTYWMRVAYAVPVASSV